MKSLQTIHLSKAFDTVCYDRLLKNFINIGIGGKYLRLISSYRVHQSTENSANIPIFSGFPQGSHLGQVLLLF